MRVVHIIIGMAIDLTINARLPQGRKEPPLIKVLAIFEEIALTCVERTMRSLCIYSVAHPLGNNFLLPLVYRTS